MKHTIQVMVENKFGVLARIASLFSARGYNIDSLAVGETQDPSISCMTIVVNAKDEGILEQINKQLHKLIDVITVSDFTRKDYIERELIFVKVTKSDGSKKVIDRLAKLNYVNAIEAKKNTVVLEICADKHQVEDVLKELKAVKIKELVRTGRIAVSK